MISYLLQLTLCWIVFYTAYHLFLREETHFNFSRWYLISALCLGLVIPLVDWSHLFIHQAESLGNLYIAPFNAQKAEWDITVQATSPKIVTWMDVVLVIYGIGSLIAAILLIREWIKILMIRQNSAMESHKDYTLALTDHHHMPFSFLKTMYCSRDFYRESPDIDQILAHELNHIRALHSLDIIFLELLKIMFWFHPMLYIYKLELRQVHEYQADHAAYNLGTKKQYGQLLLSLADFRNPVALTNPFFNSQLKNRFKMMIKKPSTRQSMLKYLVLFPLVAASIMLFSYSSKGKTMLMNTIVQQDSLLPPPPPRLPGIGEEMLMGEVKFVISTDDLLYVDGKRIGYLTQELIDQYSTTGPWVFEVYTTNTAKERFDESIETNVYSLQEMPPSLDEENKELNPENRKEGEIFRVVEQMPRFPGCEEIEGDLKQKKRCADRKLLEFIYSNVKYPEAARDNGIEGNVVVAFTIEKDGSVTEPKVIRDPGAGLGEEAIRVVHLMNDLPKKWTPGVQRGYDVRVQFILPVKFEIKKKDDNQDQGGKPLLVVDNEIIGIVDHEELNKSISAHDIESISVLKGESATIKYGMKGSNGVIEITSKWHKELNGAQLDIVNMKIYPVPAAGQINIEGVVETNGAYRLEVRDLKGAVVTGSRISVYDGNIRTNLDLRGLNAGLYYIMVIHKGKVFSRAFVKG